MGIPVRCPPGDLTMAALLKGFGCRPFADARGRRGPAFESLVRRKPRGGRGAVGGELWGFEGRGRIAGAAVGAGGSHSYRWERRRRACSIASIRGPGVSPAPGEGLRTGGGQRRSDPTRR